MTDSSQISEASQRPPFVPLFATPMYGGQCTMDYFLSMRNLHEGMLRANLPSLLHTLSNESLVPRARNTAVFEFLKTPCTHLFFVDADIGFEPQAAIDMLESGLDVVGAAYPKKKVNWTNILHHGKAGKIQTPEDVQHYSSEFVVNFEDRDLGPGGRGQVNSRDSADGKKTFFEVKEVGTAFMAIKRQVIETLWSKHTERRYLSDHCQHVGQWQVDLFGTGLDPNPVDPANPRYLSEDYFFCRLAKAAGFGVYLYREAKLTHTGTFRFEGDFQRLFVRNPAEATDGNKNAAE